jgi:hypothetical protein
MKGNYTSAVTGWYVTARSPTKNPNTTVSEFRRLVESNKHKAVRLVNRIK